MAHCLPVRRLAGLRPHPNADRLELARVGGFDLVVGKGEFRDGDLVVNVEPDYEVPVTREPFKFLASEKRRWWCRVGVRVLRGCPSEGLLVHAPDGLVEGENAMESLGVRRWVPPFERCRAGAHAQNAPPKDPPMPGIPIYDVEAQKNAPVEFGPQSTIVTVKIHGTNARYVFSGGVMHAGTHNAWRTPPRRAAWYSAVVLSIRRATGLFKGVCQRSFGVKEDVWWRTLRLHPEIETFCRSNPGVVLYGEISGPEIQGAEFSYGASFGSPNFHAFDAWDGGWWEFPRLVHRLRAAGVRCVPLVYNADIARLDFTANESCEGAGGVREGYVLRTARGHVLRKVINPEYLNMG